MPAKLIYASSNKCADMLFSSGFIACDPFIYFAVDNREGIIVSALEHGRAVNEVNPDIKVYEISDIMGTETPYAPVKDIVLKLTEMFPGNEWQIPADFPYSLGCFLQSKNVDINCIEGRFFPERETKTPEEVRALSNAMRVAEKAMQKAADMIAESKYDNSGMLRLNKEILTSELIKTEIGSEIIRGGGITEHIIVACGKHASEPHNTGSGPLYADTPIAIDIFPRIMEPADNTLSAGYWGDITRTFVKGKAPEIVKDAYRAVKLARDGSEDMIKEGVIASDVHKFAQKILNDCGFVTEKVNGVNRGFFHGLGHGVGLEVHEAPSLSLRNSQPLKAGDVVTVEPGVYYPEWGGVRLEDMIVVREKECEILTQFPDCLEIE